MPETNPVAAANAPLPALWQPRLWYPAWHPLWATCHSVPAPLLPWLQDQGSLTARLVSHSQGQFDVQLCKLYWGQAQLNEARALGINPRARVLVREVILRGCQQPWVWARSILPFSSLQGSLRCLSKLDNKPLGRWLFQQPSLRRQAFELSRFAPNDARLPLACRSQQALWGRRSVFCVQDKPVLVAEVFLPSFTASL